MGNSSRLIATTAATTALAFGGVMAAGLLNDSSSSTNAAPPADPSAAAALERDPGNPLALARLAEANRVLARRTGDSALATIAREQAEAALSADPRRFEAADTLGRLALSRHDFTEALTLSQRSRALAPGRLEPLSIAGDAQIELGRYEQGFAAVDERLDRRPDLASYAQSSYAAELRGEVGPAIRLMELAAESGVPGSFPRGFARAQLAFLRIRTGDLDTAERDLGLLDAERPGDPEAVIGRARVAAARGDLESAETLYRAGIAELPDADHLSELADVVEARGDGGVAADLRGRALGAIEALADLEDIGVERALLVADLREPTSQEIAAARSARERRPSILGDQALGWTLARSGRCSGAHRLLQRSLRTGARDSMMRFRAAFAADCAGESKIAARDAGIALSENPAFSPRWVPVAQEIAAER